MQLIFKDVPQCICQSSVDNNNDPTYGAYGAYGAYLRTKLRYGPSVQFTHGVFYVRNGPA